MLKSYTKKKHVEKCKHESLIALLIADIGDFVNSVPSTSILILEGPIRIVIDLPNNDNEES